MIGKILKTLLMILLGLVGLHTLVRIIRHIYKFPIPQFLTLLIDNPLRRKYFQPPDETAVRHGIESGMTVLEVGPGSGTYTLAAGRRVGATGKIVTIDIESKIIARLEGRIREEDVTNIEARVADVYALPFDDGYFDLAYMITVAGEIPELERAAQEISRVLKPEGTLAFSELLTDPDYPLPGTLIRKVSPTGFRVKQKIGNFFCYTLVFEKI